MHTVARPDVRCIVVIGSGAQARAQLSMLAVLGTRASVTVAGRTREHVLAARALLPGAKPAESIAAAVAEADAVFCCTDADHPVIDGADLRPGTHLSPVGGSRGPEFDIATVAHARFFAEWAGAAAEPWPAGAHELQGLLTEQLTLIGAVLDGSGAGRGAEVETTVFKSTGHGALDVAAAAAVYEYARELGIGSPVDLWPDDQRVSSSSRKRNDS
jgi:alanine dehydrogenase